MAKELLEELFDVSIHEKIMSWVEKTCFILNAFENQTIDLFAKGSKGSGDRYVAHMIAMIKFVRTNPHKASSSGFVEFYNSQPESNKYDYPKGDFGIYYSNGIFCRLLNISGE